MKSIRKSLLSLILAISILLSSAVYISAAAPTSYSKTYNSGERDEICTSLSGTSAGSYYTGTYTYSNLSAMSGSTLMYELRELMTDTHTKKTSYSECKSYSDNTDCENEDGRVVLLYSSYSATMSDFVSGSTGWNREHVWPQSLGGFSTSGAGSDLHHIRPDDVKTNSTRGNNKFGNVSGGSNVTGSSLIGSLSGGKVGGGYFEPLDNVKGDVARICLYVYVRYGGEYTQCSSITTVFQSIDVLLDWCELDPVDTWEMGRNEVVGSIQGNRNVFIDYPELAWLIFDRTIPSDMTTPSGSASGGTTPSPSCRHTVTEVRGAYAATCKNTGYTGDTYCMSCGEKVATGTVLSVLSTHSFSAWTTLSDGSLERVCSVCSKTETRPADAPTPPDQPIDPDNCTHSNTTETVIVKPTEEFQGIVKIDCLDCGHSYTDFVPPLSAIDMSGIYALIGELDDGEENFLYILLGLTEMVFAGVL